MAIVAGIAACDMSWMFAGRGNAVMTRSASSDDLSMVHRTDWCPDIGGVAVFADIARLNVREILACGICTVVAVNAVVRNVRVIEIRR